MKGISEEMRQEILLRDGVCQLCKGREDLRVEYINPNRPEITLNRPDNLTVICVACEEGWQRRGVKYMTDRWFRSMCRPPRFPHLPLTRGINLRGLWSGAVRAGLALTLFYMLGRVLF